MNLFTISFFGHRQIEHPFIIEKRLERLISTFLRKEEYIVFLVGILCDTKMQKSHT